jgi:hypothetical protein
MIDFASRMSAATEVDLPPLPEQIRCPSEPARFRQPQPGPAGERFMAADWCNRRARGCYHLHDRTLPLSGATV